MNKKIFSVLLIFYFSFSGLNVFSQFKYWIKLNDKTGTPFSISNPSAFLTQKSISRRTAYSIAVNASDLPVNPSYISQIASVPNVKVLFASKWLNGVVISVPTRSQAVVALNTISTFSFVLDTTKVKKYRVHIPEPIDPKKNSNAARTSSNTSTTSYNYGGSFWQNQQLNLICMHEQGFRGQGMTIGVMDAGFSNVDTHFGFDSIRNRNGILGTRNFVNGGTNVYLGATHGTEVLSCIVANNPGHMLGSAPMADVWLFVTEEGPTETISEEYNWIRAAEFADSVGVDLFTTSLGYTTFDDPDMDHTYASLNGRTAPMSIAATMAARKGIFVLTAAGNEGANSFHFVSVAGDADSVCTVGAVDTIGRYAAFSSVGPTSDKRIKPDLAATGVDSWITEGTSLGFGGSGTSFATPILAGAITCFWQAHKNYNNMKVLDTLKKGASNHCNPNNLIGWGIPKMCPITQTLIKSTALLETKSIHSGVKIKFIAVSPTAQNDSTYTNANGSYSIMLNNGLYKITFSRNNYKNQNYNSGLPTMIDVCSGLNGVTLAKDPDAAGDPFDFTAYADVTNSQMTILLSEANYEYVNIEVIDLAGKILLSTSSDANNTTVNFDISNLADEIYLVKVKTSKGTKTKKVLKRK